MTRYFKNRSSITLTSKEKGYLKNEIRLSILDSIKSIIEKCNKRNGGKRFTNKDYTDFIYYLDITDE